MEQQIKDIPLLDAKEILEGADPDYAKACYEFYEKHDIQKGFREWTYFEDKLIMSKDYKIKDIADLLGVSGNAIRVRRHRLKKMYY